MDRQYVERLWSLFRKKIGENYDFSEAKLDLLEDEGIGFPILSNKKGRVNGYGSHSGRSAWLFSPWKERRWYAGFEYKGIGDKGGPIRKFAGTAWGGMLKNYALDEHKYAKMAYDAGILCQRPIGVYDYGKFDGKELAVLVRAFTSPIRLSDFLFDKNYLEDYLSIRGQSENEYCAYLSETLGNSMRKMLDRDIYHGSMGINNITSEGEIADFEPTFGGTYEGLMITKDPQMKFKAIYRLMRAGKETFPGKIEEFDSGFAQAFFGEKMSFSTDNHAKEIAERYLKTKVSYEKPDPKKDKELAKVLKMLETAKKEAKTDEEFRDYDYVIKTILDQD